MANIDKADAALVRQLLVFQGTSYKNYDAGTEMFITTYSGYGFYCSEELGVCQVGTFPASISSAVLEANIDNSGSIISGTFSVEGSIPSLGIIDDTLLLAGDVNGGAPAPLFNIGFSLTVEKGALGGFEEGVVWETVINQPLPFFDESFEEVTPLISDIIGFKEVEEVSEPTTAALFGFGLVVLGLMARRQLRA